MFIRSYVTAELLERLLAVRFIATRSTGPRAIPEHADAPTPLKALERYESADQT